MRHEMPPESNLLKNFGLEGGCFVPYHAVVPNDRALLERYIGNQASKKEEKLVLELISNSVGWRDSLQFILEGGYGKGIVREPISIAKRLRNKLESLLAGNW